MAAIAGERDLITTEQLPAMPDDGIDRELYAGQLRELGTSRRGVRHTWSGTNVTAMLRGWVKTQPVPRGRVLSGDAGFRLRRNPDTTVGVDIAYISPQMAADLPDEAFLIDGAPVLAVEILSPSDVQGNIVTKVAAGVALVWIVETVFKTVTVYRPDAPPTMFNVTQRLDGDPHLPGFAADVTEVFAD
jgi:Uma2 family endonuclease